MCGTISLLRPVGWRPGGVSLFLSDRVAHVPLSPLPTDWINDAIKDAYRVKALRARKDIRGKLWAWFDGAQGWILVAIIGFLTACVAFFVDVTENVLFDYKDGYCTSTRGDVLLPVFAVPLTVAPQMRGIIARRSAA